MLGENDKVTISKFFVVVVVDSIFFIFVLCRESKGNSLLSTFLLFKADFGLAKQKNPDASKMTSMVGTILYSWYVQMFFCDKERFLLVESNSICFRICVTTLSDWFVNLAPLSQPIRSNQSRLAHFFPRFVPAKGICFELISLLDCLCCL